MSILIISLCVFLLSLLAIALSSKFIKNFNSDYMASGGWLYILLLLGGVIACCSGVIVGIMYYSSLGEQAALEIDYRSNLPLKVNLINGLNDLSVVNSNKDVGAKGMITLDNMRQSSNVSEAIKDLQLSISTYNKDVQDMQVRQRHPFIAFPIIKTDYVYRPVTLYITKDNKLGLVDTP